jgi:hypothetical protein
MRFIIATRSKDTADEIRWAARDVPGLEVHSKVITPSFAQERHERIYYGGRTGFEKPINRIK